VNAAAAEASDKKNRQMVAVIRAVFFNIKLQINNAEVLYDYV